MFDRKIKPKEKSSSGLKKELHLGKVSLSQKANFAKHLAVMLQSGVTIVIALQIIADSAQGKLKKVAQGVYVSVKNGQSLATSLSRYPDVFPKFMISSVYAGETSGTLVENLENVADQLKKEKELADKIKGAILYPTIILIAAFVLGTAVSIFILPKIVPLFEGLQIELPFTTRTLIAFSKLMQSYGIFIVPGTVIFIIFFLWFIKREFMHPITHWIILKCPIVKVIARQSNLARFCRTLGMLLRSGLTIDEALTVTKETVGNYYYKKSLRDIQLRIGKGLTLTQNLEHYEHLFPLMVVRMVRVGEESGNLESTLIYVADFYEGEVDVATKALSTTIEPVLLLCIGFLVGFLALSIISPIYNITGGVSRG